MECRCAGCAASLSDPVWHSRPASVYNPRGLHRDFGRINAMYAVGRSAEIPTNSE